MRMMYLCRGCGFTVAKSGCAFHVIHCTSTNLTNWLAASTVLSFPVEALNINNFVASICPHYWISAEPNVPFSSYTYHILKKTSGGTGALQSTVDGSLASPKYLRQFTADCNCQ